MIVEQDGGIGHRTEAYGWDANLPQIPGVGACWKYLRLHSEVVFEEGVLHSRVPGILVVHRGERLVCELDDELQLNVAPSLSEPATHLLLELDDVRGGSDPDVEVEDELVRHHVDLDPARHQSQVDGGDVAQGEAGVGLQSRLLLSSELQQFVDDLLGLLPRGVLQEPGAVPGAALAGDLHLEHIALPVVERNLLLRPGQTLVQTEANIERFELSALDKLGHPVLSSNLLVRNEGEVNRPPEPHTCSPQPPDGLDMLDTNTLHVLGPSPVDVAGLVLEGGEGFVCPVFGEDRDHVSVGVEDDGGQRGVCPLPGDDQDGLARHALVTCLGQPQGLGLLHQELYDWLVVGVWLNRGDSHVISEQFGGWILLGHSEVKLSLKNDRSDI